MWNASPYGNSELRQVLRSFSACVQEALIVKCDTAARTVAFLRSNAVAPDPRVEKEAVALHEAGWNVLIMAWDRSCSLPHEERDYASVFRIRIHAPFGAGIRNVPRKLRWNLALLRWLIANRKKYSHIHACDYDTIMPALAAKLLFGKKVVYDVFDHILLSPTTVSGQGIIGMLQRTSVSVLAGVMKFIEYWAIRRADAVILVDECRKPLIEGSKPRRLTYIYNTPPAQVAGTQAEKEHSPRLCIAYVGVLYRERGLIEMLDVVNQHPEFSLSLAGFGGDQGVIASKAASIPNVRFLGTVSYERALAISTEADVLFATYDPGLPFHKYSSANKLFEAMMLGKPIIVARGTGMDEVVTRYDIGRVVEYGDIESLEDALVQIASMTVDERRALSERARKLYETSYSWDLMRSRLLELYESM